MPSFPSFSKENSFVDSILASLPVLATIPGQKLAQTVLRGPRISPFGELKTQIAMFPVTRLAMAFPGVSSILSSHLHAHEYLRSGFGTAG